MKEHQPLLVLMYGKERMPSWNAIAQLVVGREFPPEGCAPGDLPSTSVLTHGRMILACTPRPVSRIRDGVRYLGNEYWIRLGTELRKLTRDSPAPR